MDMRMAISFIFLLTLVKLSVSVYEAPQHKQPVYKDEPYKEPTYKESLYKTPPPRILSHKQAQSHDGGFKYAFAAENGLAQTEVIAPDGSRNGGYSYVDPHGKTISVRYTAGKEGFKILEGEHIPRDPQQQQQQQQQPQHLSLPSQQPKPHYLVQDEESKYGYQPKPQYITHKSHLISKYVPQQVKYSPPPPPPPPPPSSQYKYSAQLKPYPLAVPQARYVPKPEQQQYEAPPTQEASASNSVEQEKEPEYNDEPGKPYSFGVGYAFHFGS